MIPSSKYLRGMGRWVCALIAAFLLLAAGAGAAAGQGDVSTGHSRESCGPLRSAAETSFRESPVFRPEPPGETPKKIWNDLPYTDRDVARMAERGFLWMLGFMNSGDNLKGNENNYLTMLATMYGSARDPRLRKAAREEARKVVCNRVLSADFVGSELTDYNSLIKYLSLLNQLDLPSKTLAEATFRKLEKEKRAIRDEIRRQGQKKLDDDEIYEIMLLTYHITNLKKHFPREAILDDMPDLGDFFQILAGYTYHMEHVENPDFSTLEPDDVNLIMSDLYNITHVFFVVCNYNACHVPKDYFRREVAYMLKYFDLICSRHYYDPDLLTEIAYVFRLMGYPMNFGPIKIAWMQILDSQKADGSWHAYGVDEEDSDRDRNYDVFHATWVAVDMLVDPVMKDTAPFYKPLTSSLIGYADSTKRRPHPARN